MGRDLNDVVMEHGPDAIKQEYDDVMSAAKIRAADDIIVLDKPKPAPAEPPKRLGVWYGEMGRPKPTNWLIKGVLEANVQAIIVGRGAVGKTFLAVAWACHVATGIPFDGHEVKQGAVVYIAGEGRANIHKRFEGWAIANKVDLSQAPLLITNHGTQIDSPAAAEDLANWINAECSARGVTPKLVIIDTLARNFGGDENAAKDVNLYVQMLDAKLRVPYGACVLTIHHVGNNDAGRGRGSSAFFDSWDVSYWVERIDDDSFTLVSKKMKDGPRPQDKAYRRFLVELPDLEDDGTPITSAVIRPTQAMVTRESDGEIRAKKVAKLRGDNQKHAVQVIDNMLTDACSAGKTGMHGAPVGRPFVEVEDAVAAVAPGMKSSVKKHRTQDAKRAIDALVAAGFYVVREPYIWAT
jgi:hypothetical protein